MHECLIFVTANQGRILPHRRVELTSTPPGFPQPRADLPGAVHKHSQNTIYTTMTCQCRSCSPSLATAIPHSLTGILVLGCFFQSCYSFTKLLCLGAFTISIAKTIKGNWQERMVWINSTNVDSQWLSLAFYVPKQYVSYDQSHRWTLSFVSLHTNTGSGEPALVFHFITDDLAGAFKTCLVSNLDPRAFPSFSMLIIT